MSLKDIKIKSSSRRIWLLVMLAVVFLGHLSVGICISADHFPEFVFISVYILLGCSVGFGGREG